MPDDSGTFPKITVQRARVLKELYEGWTAREAADRLAMTYNGIRSHLANLKALTGCRTVGELARWWRTNRTRWALFMLEAAGVALVELAHEDHDSDSH